MTDDPEKPADDLQTLWQNQPTETTTMSIEEIHQRAKKFQSKIFWRNTREYVLAFFVAIFLCYQIVVLSDVFLRIGFLLILSGIAAYAFILHTRGRAEREGLAESGEDTLNFHRKSLSQQRDLVGSVWAWGILPVVPGIVLILARRLQLTPADKHIAIYGAAAVVFMLLAGLALLNLWGARKLQKRIDALGDQS